MPSAGFGAAASLNLSRHFALDTNYLVTSESTNGATNLYGGHGSELLLGLRAEVRTRHYGFYLKAQPGYFAWSHLIKSVSFPTPDTFVFHFGNRTEFAAVFGAGFEYSASSRIQVRAGVSDLLTRDQYFSNVAWRNHLQPEVGIYYGFGKSTAW